MSYAYVVGQITVQDDKKWAEYRARVPETLAPWGAELVFRGQLSRELHKSCPYSDIVVIRFPDQAAVDGWHDSAAYQALLPLRGEAADLVLLSYRG
ncbi:MAG TPA: DUF1330 domain-containing protein [Accumulibacter sp.]|jgi:uncharacterized protein (DUF1330 family)|nr:DUF1330 domain-containing protein [Accumulibacter sp.]HQC80801.1 DUF1330 domain-containing protein [Accumulibacter sp.]